MVKIADIHEDELKLIRNAVDQAMASCTRQINSPRNADSVKQAYDLERQKLIALRLKI